MPVLKNARHERFCQLVVSGKTADAAYKEAGFSSDRGNAARLTANDSVKARIAELNNEAAKLAKYEKADMIRDLVSIIKGKPSAANMERELCELRMSAAGPYAAFPDKLTAMTRLAKMLGWDEAEKQEVNGVTEIVIRKL